MANACCTSREAEANPDHAVPHFRDLAGHIAPVAQGPLDYAYGAGSIHASARDMANWLRFQLADGVFDGRRLLPAEVLRETHTAQMVIRHEGLAKASSRRRRRDTLRTDWAGSFTTTAAIWLSRMAAPTRVSGRRSHSFLTHIAVSWYLVTWDRRGSRRR